MKEYNKIIDHIGYKFNVCVIPYYKMEKTPNGKHTHRITVNDTGVTNYYMQRDLEAPNTLPQKGDFERLEIAINLLTNDAKQWAEKREEHLCDFQESFFTNLGFRQSGTY